MPREERLREWSAAVQLLANIYDRLGALLSVEIQATGNKAPIIHPYPRPVVAAQRQADAARRRRHDRLSARLYPNRRA